MKTTAELIEKRIKMWKKFREGEEKRAEEKRDIGLYKQWGIERVDLDKNPKDNDWSEEEMAELGHS